MKTLLKFFIAAVVMMGAIVSCTDKNEGPEGSTLELGVSPSAIMADGVSKATFTVTFDGDDVTEDAVIRMGGVALAGNEFTSDETGTFKFTAHYDGMVSNEVTVTVNEVVDLYLSVDNNVIRADGEHLAEFTVFYGGEDITDQMVPGGDLQICDPDGVCLAFPAFSTDTPAEYHYTAKLWDSSGDMPVLVAESNSVTITAIRVDGGLELMATKTALVNDGEDETVFTVFFNGDDVTEDAVIKLDGEVFDETMFSSEDEGTFTFTAEYNEQVSEPIVVTVYPVGELVFVVDKNVIMNDSRDEAVFTVVFNAEDVTDQATISVNGTGELSGNTFSSTTTGTYRFIAELDALTSDEITVVVQAWDAPPVYGDTFDADRALYKATMMHILTEVECGPCVTLKNNIVAAGPESRIVPIYLYESSSGNKVTSVIDPRDKPIKPIYVIYQKQLVDARYNFAINRGEGYPLSMIGMNNPSDRFVGYSSVDAIRAKCYEKITGPARTGIKVEPEVSNGRVNFTVSVGASIAGKYRVSAVLTEDGIVYAQYVGGGTDYNYVHNNVFRDYVSQGLLGVELGEMTKGQVETKNFSIAVNRETFKGGLPGQETYGPLYTRSNLSLVVYTLYNDGTTWVVENAMKVPIDQTTGFAYVN